jgi:hypothetical protein
VTLSRLPVGSCFRPNRYDSPRMSRIDPRPRELTVIRPIRFDTLAPCLLRLIQLPLPSLIRRSNRNPTIGLPRPCRHCRQPVPSHSHCPGNHSHCPGNAGLNAPQPTRLAGRSDRDGADDLRVGRTPGPVHPVRRHGQPEQEMNGWALAAWQGLSARRWSWRCLASGSGDIRGDYRCGVPVERGAGAVISHGGARVGAGGGLLDVPQRDAGVEEMPRTTPTLAIACRSPASVCAATFPAADDRHGLARRAAFCRQDAGDRSAEYCYSG